MTDSNIAEGQLKHPCEKLLARQAIREFATNIKFSSEEAELMTVARLIIKIENIIDLL